MTTSSSASHINCPGDIGNVPAASAMTQLNTHCSANNPKLLHSSSDAPLLQLLNSAGQVHQFPAVVDVLRMSSVGPLLLLTETGGGPPVVNGLLSGLRQQQSIQVEVQVVDGRGDHQPLLLAASDHHHQQQQQQPVLVEQDRAVMGVCTRTTCTDQQEPLHTSSLRLEDVTASCRLDTSLQAAKDTPPPSARCNDSVLSAGQPVIACECCVRRTDSPMTGVVSLHSPPVATH